MTKTSKIVAVTVVFVVAVTAALSVDAYGDYVLASRQLAYLAVKIKLSGISESVKNQLLADVYLNNPKNGLGFALDFSNSNAGYIDDAGISVDCNSLMQDFAAKAGTCIAATPENWLSKALYSCPDASNSADALSNQCNLHLGWR